MTTIFHFLKKYRLLCSFVFPCLKLSSDPVKMADESYQSLFFDCHDATNASASYSGAPPSDLNAACVQKLLIVLREQPWNRDEALCILSKKRDNYEELALALWHSNLTATILLQEVLGGYRLLEQTKVSKMETDRVCNALTLFMRVAQYRETRIPFLRAKIPEYLYPFLNATQTGQHIEFLKFSSLSVLVSLVQDNDPEAVHFLLGTEVFPKCLRCMEHGSETTKILATRVISKILTQEEGVLYCCDHKVRFYSVANVMAGIVDGIEQGLSPLLLKHIIDCYLRFSTDHRAAVALKQILPENLTNPSFINMKLSGQVVAMEKLNQLLYNINIA